MLTGLLILAAVLGAGALVALFAGLIGVAVAGGALVRLRDRLKRNHESDGSHDA